MRSPIRRRPLVYVIALVVCSSAHGYPTEADINRKLHEGMTADEVVRVFGEPNVGNAATCVNCTFTYIPPIGCLVDKYGYRGVAIDFADGRVSLWRIQYGNPSYEVSKMPRIARWYLWAFGVLFALSLIAPLLVRAIPRALYIAKDVERAFEERRFDMNNLPLEFRFITPETTLQQVFDRLGTPDRMVKVPINAERGFGYALVSTNTAPPLLHIAEYDLPYQAAVIVIPEFPFAPENRIRAVVYRRIQSDLAEAAE